MIWVFQVALRRENVKKIVVSCHDTILYDFLEMIVAQVTYHVLEHLILGIV
jgi:hypothetical protein